MGNSRLPCCGIVSFITLHNAFHGSSLGVVFSVIPLFWVEGRQRRPPLPVKGCGFSAVFLFYNWSPACVAIGAGIA